MNKLRLSLGLMGASVLLFPACGGGGGSSTGGAGSAMDIEQVANGFGQLLPHTIRKVDAAGAPTQTIISIRKESDFVTNVVPGNPVLPTPQWPTNAILPNGAARLLPYHFGSHEVMVQYEFGKRIRVRNSRYF